MKVDFDRLDEDDPLFIEIMDEYSERSRKAQLEAQAQYLAELIKINYDLEKKYNLKPEPEKGYYYINQLQDHISYSKKDINTLVEIAGSILKRKYSLKIVVFDKLKLASISKLKCKVE